MPQDGFEDKLSGILARRDELGALMAEAQGDYAALAKEYAQLQPVADGIEAWRAAKEERRGLEELLAEAGADPELRALAKDDLERVKAELAAVERAVKLSLLPKDAADDKSAIVEIRAGTGGDEAALFAADLLKMYQRYASLQGWRTELLDLVETDLGGVKDAALEVTGQGAFARLKWEAGVHRVQRVPLTETQGRVHTSAATVAVLPEAEDVDVEVDEADLRVDVFRASGAGGQHVNKTESAVRITHAPSGIVVAIQDEKSQHKNRAKAMKILRARLYDQQRAELDAQRSADRKGQVGSGDRSERVRTYNFPQGRVSDHRINLTLHKLEQVLAGDALGEVIEALIAEDQARLLADTEQA